VTDRCGGVGGAFSQARKLTPEERREKKRKKIIADKSKEVRHNSFIP
jgi:hypothetical protein